ncbi:MAG: OmpA family protein, partial [Beijerinckiaceae bacterium]
MCQPKKWWLGLLPLAALWLATLWLKTAPIESDLATRAGVSVTTEKVGSDAGRWVQIAVAGRDVTISGAAPAEGLQLRAADAADRTFGVRLVNAAATLLPEQKPFTWSAALDGKKLLLTGFVTPDGAREKIVAAAKAAFPGAEIFDEMKLARGAATTLTERASFGLSQLSKLSRGAASLSDAHYTIVGDAPTSEIYAATLAATKALPHSMNLSKADITPPTAKPFLWSAERKGNDVTLSGFVPSEEARGSILDGARRLFSGAAIADQMQIAAGAPQNFVAAALAGLGQLGTLVEGKASLSDLNYALSGRSATFDVNTVALGTDARGKLPPGFATQVAVDAPPPPPPPLPTARPFVWSATKAADAMSVTGFAPSDGLAKAAADAVASLAPGARFTNETRVAQGLPNGVDFSAATSFAGQQLRALRSGSVRLSDNQLSLTGEAPDLAVYNDTLARLNGALPGGLVRDQVALTVAPYGWGVAHANGAVTLTGLVPDDRSRQAILAQAAKSFPGARIIDQMAVAAGGPSCYAAMTIGAMEQLAKLESGRAQFDGALLNWSGQAPNQAASDQVTAAATTGWPNCVRASATLTVRPPPPPPAPAAPPPAAAAPVIAPPDLPPPAAVSGPPSLNIAMSPVAPPPEIDRCQTLIRDALTKDRILFDTARATIRAESQAVLAHIAETLKSCPSARFEVAAHTDSDGDDADNLALSDRRARAVVDFLAERHKIATDRLLAKGYGESKP